MRNIIGPKFSSTRFYLLTLLFLTFVFGEVTSSQPEVTRTEMVDRAKLENGGEGVCEVCDGKRRTVEKKFPVKDAVIIAAAMESPSLLMRQPSPSGDIFIGYLDDLVHEISSSSSSSSSWFLSSSFSEMSSFRFQWLIVESSDGKDWLNKRAELTEKLTNREANISILALNATIQNNEQRLSYSRPFLRTTISLLSKLPPNTPNPRPITLQELIARSNSSPQFGVIDETIAVRLRTSNSTLYHQIWRDKTPSEVVVTQEEGLSRVRQGDFVLIVESTDAEYLSSMEPCDLTVSEQSMMETNYVFAALENSSILEQLDRQLGVLGSVDRNSDFFGSLYKKWWSSDDCNVHSDREGGGGGGGNVGNHDHDLDMERIFFTSPIKFFKSNLRPSSQDGRIAKSTPEGLQFQVTITTKRPSEPTKHIALQTKPFDRNHLNAVSTSKHNRDSNRRRRRTTTPSTTTIIHSQSRTFPNQHDPTHYHRRSTRVRYPSSTVPVRNSVNLAYSDGDLKSGRYEGGEDKATRQITTLLDKARTTLHRGQFANDINWFFVTHEPRYPQEMIYDDDPENDDDDDDDDDYTEQKAAYEALDSEEEVPATIRNMQYKPNSSTATRVDVLLNTIVIHVLVALTVTVRHFRYRCV